MCFLQTKMHFFGLKIHVYSAVSSSSSSRSPVLGHTENIQVMDLTVH